MGISLDKSGAGVSIALADTIDISCAAELKSLLIEALSSGADLRISLDDATGLDVTASQLLWAAERQARQSGVGFRFSEPVPDAVSAELAEAGFQPFSALVHAAEESTGCEVVSHS
jgi:anti-anti-sigma regulatory factor